MALGAATTVIRLALARAIATPNVTNLRVARLRVKQGLAVNVSLSTVKRAASLGVCWIKAQTIARAVIATALIDLKGRIRRRVPYRTGDARRSVTTGSGSGNFPVTRNFEFDIGDNEIYHAGIGVPYAPYLKDVDIWFNEICDEWFEETASRAVQTFLVFYIRCATRN